MKKVFVLLAFLCCLAFGQDNKIAVYVTGDIGAGEKKALGTKMLTAFVNSGKYTAIERSDAFLKEIAKEQEKQHSGEVDDSQISRLGKQFGVQFVCIADITSAFNSNHVSARIIDVETAEVVTIGEAASQLKSMEDLDEVSNKIVTTMFGKKSSKKKAKNDEEGDNFTTGERWKTFGFNILLPGAGYIAVMDDWTGAIVSWSLVAAGALIGHPLFGGEFGSKMESILAGMGIGHLVGAGIWNIIRSSTYDKPSSKNAAYNAFDGFNMAVLPSKHGSFNAYFMYNKAF
ncbi:MAG: CsgG/HfaB family protein [Fibromonadales bacterium]|nr:CsgG/HfaB family protein [Fibromonadales bacterium]